MIASCGLKTLMTSSLMCYYFGMTDHTALHSGFLPQYLFRFETSSVHFMSRETDISNVTIDDFTSKLIKYGKESKEKKISFDVKSSIVSCEISFLQLMK